MKAPQRVETGKFYVSHHETESETLQRLTLFAKGFTCGARILRHIRIVKYYLTRSG